MLENPLEEMAQPGLRAPSLTWRAQGSWLQKPDCLEPGILAGV